MATGNGKGATNGKRSSDGKIRVAIVGVGNCASSLVQGRYYYEDAKAGDLIPGLMHVDLGGYHIGDVELVAAFDGVAGRRTQAAAARFKVPAERGPDHIRLHDGKVVSFRPEHWKSDRNFTLLVILDLNSSDLRAPGVRDGSAGS